MDELVKALRAGEQADMDGTLVKVSRQACEEAADAIEALQAEMTRLRKLDVEYGRVEVAIIMADPHFDGDSDHANCADKLIASVQRMKAPLDEARDKALDDAAMVADGAPYKRGGIVCGCSEGLAGWTATAIRALKGERG